MNTTLKADCVAVTDEDGVLLVGFADNEFETTSYLMLQRPHEYDAQDRALGMDRVFIERDDQAQSAYGGVETIVLYRDGVVLHLDEHTATMLGSTRQIEIAFDLGEDKFERLKLGLCRLFEGTACLDDQTL